MAAKLTSFVRIHHDNFSLDYLEANLRVKKPRIREMGIQDAAIPTIGNKKPGMDMQ